MREFLRTNAKWLGAGALLTFLSGFGQTYFIAIFAGALRSEFDLSHGAWGGIYTIGTLASALVMVWAGGLADRFRVRALGPVVLGLLSLACLAMAVNSTVWLLPAIIFFLRFAGQGMSTHLAHVSMARWFVATRGRALAIASLGYSVGEGLLPVACVALMAFVDWRLIWVGGAFVALAGVPILLTLLRTERTPAATAQDQNATGMNGRHWTRREALGDPLFWIMLPAVAGLSAFGTVFFFQQVLFAEVKGWSHLQLTALFPLYPLVSMGAMLVWGWALDRIGTARLLPFFMLPITLAFLLFALTDSIFGTLLGLVAFGITSGANATVPTAFWSEFYGTRHIGAIKALATAVMVFGSAVGPGISGLMLDAGIGLLTQFQGFAVYFVVVTLLLTLGIRKAARKLPVTAAS
ncbi:MFS transporter [Pseudaestuariivita atlantica]|uniref:MFS transporter n=1 Tax=Pseudaestuariivita atlantica TaxID=1317121 RepID=A0A0L1JPQ2_9RHOB|nr:MFS transporter [Pseudaestuariivita atlantica]KNG93711.1 MFS transporter [Pseudaestuariivita atlantica]